ncbi:cationic amino acid transporter 8, vacuolar-like [Punica granatum]|uniref:Cationic amino acid transporter C-terminal domain-containing protein n=2 Tax=Punica granatum TaxID=22663 RepID=A0A218X8M4_PUNGR|nr:cationic amino acid transporter 8, vacuolar-like [Punica granatum]OWM81026.1 hypothetical protein CDL15_Pgr007057 [Punica granatum]PKI47643.1 hypothetical protein CRG98_031929 [Punica granatum]
MESLEAKQAAEERRSYWRWSKEDFFPEQSFENLASYRTAFSQTGYRLKERFLSRSTQEMEMVSARRESEHEMKRCLNWWDLVWLCFGSVVGSGIFVITGQEAHDNAGPAIILSYAISGLSALLSVFCYTEFSVEIPVAGGSFSFLRIELGDFVAFITAGNILLEAIVGAAGLGRAWTSYFTSMFNNNPDFLRIYVPGLPEGFNMLDPLGMVVIWIANSIAIYGTRQASTLNWIGSVVSAGLIVFITVVAFTHANTSNLVPFFPFGAGGVFRAAAVVYWSYTGFDMVATLAEETKKPSRDIPIGLAGSMSLITVVYCIMCLALTMMVKYTEIDRNAAYSVAFASIGMNWAKYIVSLCALKGMTSSLLVNAMGQARYMTQIARAHMIPPWFSLVHPKTGTPIYATLLVAVFSSIAAFFSSLDVLSTVLSFSTLFIFMLMAVALLVRRYYDRDSTPTNQLNKLIACLVVIITSCIGGTAVWNGKNGRWPGYVIACSCWFLGTLGLQLLPKQRAPKKWGIPLVPWLPSLSIGMNLFLLGSLGPEALWRFLICTVVMILYYLLVGVHATYDVAHPTPPESKAEARM